MAMFQQGETVVCSLVVRDSAGNLHDPLTSTQIKITDGRGIDVVPDTDMLNDGVGLFHYDFTATTAHQIGRYRLRYTTVDTGRTTIVDEHFELENGPG